MLIAAPFPACDRHKLTPNFSWWRSLRIHPAAVTKWEQLICRGFSLLPHRHTAQSVCSCFSPVQENSKNPTPTSISISLRGISLLLHGAGPSWAGVQEVPFNCFTCLLQSWPRETEIKYFALRACQSASSSVSWQHNTTANLLEFDLQKEWISSRTSHMPPVEQSRGLHIPKLPKQNPGGLLS